MSRTMRGKPAAANSQCLTIDELLTPRAQPSCVGCICNICLLWWSGRCPYGHCYDDIRAYSNPYDAAHPGKIRKSWSNWAAPGEQSHWCRGGILYHAYTCEHYKPYRKPVAHRCLGCNVWIWADGYVYCPLVDAIGCAECMRAWETDIASAQ